MASHDLLTVRWSSLSVAQRAILLGAPAFVVWFFAATCQDVSAFHGADLGPKVLGARAMLEGTARDVPVAPDDEDVERAAAEAKRTWHIP